MALFCYKPPLWRVICGLEEIRQSRFGSVELSPAALVRAAFTMFESPLPNKSTTQRVVLLFGGLEEIRTPDPHNANVVRSQLRYKPG